MAGEIGKVTSVDFSWYLDTRHGADYFRRWHRLREKSGSLWVHKATHHFDLINWWLDADPVEVSRTAASRTTARAGPFRHTNCRSCPHKTKCDVSLGHQRRRAAGRALRRLRVGRRLHARWLRLQGRHRHLRHDERGREVLERREHELLGQHVHADRGLPPRVQRDQGPARSPRLRAAAVGSGRRDRDAPDQELRPAEEDRDPDARRRATAAATNVLRDLVFKKIDVPEHMRLPDSRAGAMSCLTGIAARKSCDSGAPVRSATRRRRLRCQCRRL